MYHVLGGSLSAINGIADDEDNPSILNADRGIVVLHETLGN